MGRFRWLYGDDPGFFRKLDDNGEEFIADMHKNQWINCGDTKPIIPPPKLTWGRKSSMLKV